MPTFEIDTHKMMHHALTAGAKKVRGGTEAKKEADPGKCPANSSREGTSVSKSWSLLLGRVLGQSQ